jgi:hypothetical protein
MNAAMNVKKEMTQLLKDLHLPTVRQCYEPVAREAERESVSYENYLLEVIRKECEQRRQKKIVYSGASRSPIPAQSDH